MKLSTALNHEQRLINQIDSIYSNVIASKAGHGDILASMKAQVWSDPGLKRCPHWVHHGLIVHAATWRRRIYDHLVWGFMGSDGTPRPLHDLQEPDRQAVLDGAIPGRHYWREAMGKTIDRLPDGSVIETIKWKLSPRYY